jgi:aspartokinase-like uncharacterized kinase
VPGGGPFADAVRAVDDELALPAPVSHRIALAAMDQLGQVLAHLLPGAAIQRELRAPQGLALLSVAETLTGRPEIPERWDVTSDSLAVFAAGAIGAREAILLKPLERPLGDAETLTTDALGVLQVAGGATAVDAYLPFAIRLTGVVVEVRGPRTRGTRIVP